MISKLGTKGNFVSLTKGIYETPTANSILFFFFKFLYFERERAREHVRQQQGGGQRERERESHADSTEPNTGLHLMNH